MNEIKDIISFGYGTGLNWDDDPALLPKGDGKYRKNVSLEEGGHYGTLTRSRGNTKLSNVQHLTSAVEFGSSTNGNYTLYGLSILSYYFYAGSSFIRTIFNIKTDNGYYKIYHNSGTYTSVTEACAAIKTKIENIGDPLIGEVSYTVGDPTTLFKINILTNSSVKAVQHITTTASVPYINYFADKDIVGTYYDTKDNELYCFWSYDDEGRASPWSDNLITVYRYDENAAELLNSEYLSIPSTIAKWNKQNPIKATVVSDADDKMLYWTDGVHGVMKINVNTALNTMYGYYGDTYSDHSTDTLRKQALSVAKITPQWSPLTEITEGAYGLRGTNVEVAKYACQFMCRFIFDDNEKSNWSVVSPLSDFTEENPMGYIDDEGAYYKITLKTATYSTNTIKYVEFAFRRFNTDTWKSFTTQDFSTTPGYVEYDFNGFEHFTEVAASEANQLFENIPIQSGTLEFLPSSHLVFGDNTMGYDNVTTSVTVEAAAYDATLSYPPYYVEMTTASATSKTSDFTSYNLTGEAYLAFATNYGSWVVPAHNASLGAAETIANYITENIVGVDPYVTSATGSGFSLTINHSSGQWVYGYVALMPPDTKMDFAKIKNGATHYTCLFYYDQFDRMCYAQPLSSVYVPFYTEQAIYTNNEYEDVIKLTIAHQPPVWAHYWSIGYGLSSVQQYKQILVKTTDFVRENDILKLQLDTVLNRTREMLPNITLNYQFTKGDRIRWIGTLGTYTNASEVYNRVTLLGNYIDTEVLGLAGDWSEYLCVPDYRGNTTTDSDAIDAATYVLVELYTPNKFSEPTFYYETPFKFAVTSSGTTTAYHNVTTNQSNAYGITCVNQDATHDAVCWLSKMDYRLHQFWCFDTGKPITCYMDSEHFSNYFESKTKSIGRPSIENKDARQARLNNLLYTSAYIADTRVNGLSNINFTSEKKVDDKFGRITGLEVAGDILNIIQQSKINSIYLGAQLAVDAQGNQTVSYTGEVLGNIRPRSEDYGSEFKGSILRVGQNLYGFDMQASVVWRTDYNGIQNLTDYSRKMKSYITAKCQTLLASGRENIIVLTGFDHSKQLLYITFVDLYSSTNSETLAFHEPTNRWISFYDFIPDMYASIENLQFLTIKSGYLYKHEDSTATRSNFYGTTYDSLVHATSNIYPSEIKAFNSIKEDANAIWDMPDDDSIVVDEEDIEFTNPVDYTRHKSGMQSRLKSARFRYKNGNFHAAFLNDMTTTGTATQKDLFTGRKLRGRYITCKLENNDNAAVYLRSVQINAQKSN